MILLLVYRKQSNEMQESFPRLQYFLVTKSREIIAGNFNYDLSKMLGNKYFDIFKLSFRLFMILFLWNNAVDILHIYTHTAP